MSYGTLIIHIEDDQTDRIGIRTLTLSQLWQPTTWPMTIAELDALEPDIPDVPSGVLFVGKQTRPQKGCLKTYWVFEGVNGDGKSVTFKDRSTSIDCEYKPGFAEVSLLKSPKWPTLRDSYGLDNLDGQIVWQDTIPASAGGSGLAGGNSQAGQPNPIFGYDTYLRIEATYLFRYAVFSPSQIPDIDGKIFETGSLPGVVKPVGTRNWLGGGTPYVRRGPVLDVTEIYWLSGDGGWPTPIYGNATSGITATDGLSGGSSNGGSIQGAAGT